MRKGNVSHISELIGPALGNLTGIHEFQPHKVEGDALRQLETSRLSSHQFPSGSPVSNASASNGTFREEIRIAAA
ncbi:MAG: hypothetical protein LW750_00445 [Bacteroidetes bacterium]|jgi:hypothetical protein|nr:hypothetical protein [Bacteroidota bacterium]